MHHFIKVPIAPVLAFTLIELLLAIAILIALYFLIKAGLHPAPPTAATLPKYPPTTGGATSSLAAGSPTLPQGSWSGATSQARGTSATYTFLRQTYNAGSSNPNPYAPAPGVQVRFRLEAAPGERADITGVDPGQQVGSTPWWTGVTPADGQLVVTVYVAPANEEVTLSSTTLSIIGEELDADGDVVRGAVWTITVVPAGQ